MSPFIESFKLEPPRRRPPPLPPRRASRGVAHRASECHMMSTSQREDRELSEGAPFAASGAGSRMLWPSANAGSFARTTPSNPQMQPVKMIRVPEVYVATHDTMPPLQQVIHAASTATTLRELYQQADRKMTGKRDSATVASDANAYEELRQAKTPRAN